MNNEQLEIFKKKLVDALIAFDQICTEHNLNYYACAGTALGAIRHKGIIPWDDDIDVFMFREDYDKLMALSENIKNSSNYTIAKLGDKGYIYPFAKFYDASTTLVEIDTFQACVIGVYIDVFPVDEVNGDEESISAIKREYDRLFHHFQCTYKNFSLRYFFACFYHRNFKELIEVFINKFRTERKKNNIRQTFIDYEVRWQKTQGSMLLCHHGMYPLRKELMPKYYFDDYEYVPFEGTQIRIMKRWDEYLIHLFGDYMTPPPVEQQITHHSHYYLNLRENLNLKEIKHRLFIGEHTVI